MNGPSVNAYVEYCVICTICTRHFSIDISRKTSCEKLFTPRKSQFCLLREGEEKWPCFPEFLVLTPVNWDSWAKTAKTVKVLVRKNQYSLRIRAPFQLGVYHTQTQERAKAENEHHLFYIATQRKKTLKNLETWAAPRGVTKKSKTSILKTVERHI